MNVFDFDKSEFRCAPAEVQSGMIVLCAMCGEKHVLAKGMDENGEYTEMLLYYTCHTKSITMLAAVDMKLVGSTELFYG